jgi:hypothetical protein
MKLFIEILSITIGQNVADIINFLIFVRQKFTTVTILNTITQILLRGT